jgi:hypothetical protein
MKWDALSAEERNRLVAEKVMNWQAKECESNLIEVDYGWECSVCGLSGDWGNDFNRFSAHLALPPRYTQSLDAAWLVLQKVAAQFDEQAAYMDEVFEYFRDELFCCSGDEIYPATRLLLRMAEWTPEHICKVALRATGISIDEQKEDK